MSLQALVPVLLGLQFAAFGWRINREIEVGDQNRLTWLPVSDYVNIVSLLSVVSLCIVWPLTTDDFSRVAKTVLAIGYMLVALHPINVATHYRLLFSTAGRSNYLKTSDGDYPYITDHERISLTVSLVMATMAGWFVWNGP